MNVMCTRWSRGPLSVLSYLMITSHHGPIASGQDARSHTERSPTIKPSEHRAGTMTKAEQMHLTTIIGQPGTSGGKNVSAEYRNVIAKDGFPALESITTLYELWIER